MVTEDVLTFSHLGKWLDKKAKVNFKIYDVTGWTIITIQMLLISQEVKETRQLKLVSS